MHRRAEALARLEAAPAVVAVGQEDRVDARHVLGDVERVDQHADVGEPVRADVGPYLGMPGGPVPNSRRDLFHGAESTATGDFLRAAVLQEILQLAGLSPDRTTPP